MSFLTYCFDDTLEARNTAVPFAPFSFSAQDRVTWKKIQLSMYMYTLFIVQW